MVKITGPDEGGSKTSMAKAMRLNPKGSEAGTRLLLELIRWLEYAVCNDGPDGRRPWLLRLQTEAYKLLGETPKANDSDVAQTVAESDGEDIEDAP